MNRDEIIERLGAENWRMVVDEFDGLSVGGIEQELNYMYPGDIATGENYAFSHAIYDEIN